MRVKYQSPRVVFDSYFGRKLPGSCKIRGLSLSRRFFPLNRFSCCSICHFDQSRISMGVLFALLLCFFPLTSRSCRRLLFLLRWRFVGLVGGVMRGTKFLFVSSCERRVRREAADRRAEFLQLRRLDISIVGYLCRRWIEGPCRFVDLSQQALCPSSITHENYLPIP